jgi:hypothetical protein
VALRWDPKYFDYACVRVLIDAGPGLPPALGGWLPVAPEAASRSAYIGSALGSLSNKASRKSRNSRIRTSAAFSFESSASKRWAGARKSASKTPGGVGPAMLRPPMLEPILPRREPDPLGHLICSRGRPRPGLTPYPAFPAEIACSLKDRNSRQIHRQFQRQGILPCEIDIGKWGGGIL